LFDRPHHRRIARVLECLDADLLLKHRCLFGGGTAIALSHGEFRESMDIDFICASVEGYRELRGLVNKGGIDAALQTPVPVLRDPRIDQYGIRCAFAVDDQPVKFEIVFEGRIALADPLQEDKVCGVWTLRLEDMVATKLMANSDRWADSAVMSRDLVDLAMLGDHAGGLPDAGIAKALHAYGDSIVTDLDKARQSLLGREGRLEHCMRAMGIHLPAQLLRLRVERLHLGQGTMAKTGRPRRKRP
jgi:hypothetical protein